MVARRAMGGGAIGVEARMVPGSVQAGTGRVEERVKRAKYNNMRHAAASIRKDAAGSIKQKKKKSTTSPAGGPPFQHESGFFRRGLRYWVDRVREDALVGFLRSVVGHVAATHEHGKMEEGRQYPERAIVAPALERNIDRFARNWRASI